MYKLANSQIRLQIWADTARSRIARLPAIPCVPPSTIYSTFDDLVAAEAALSQAMISGRQRLQADEVAIDRAKQDLRRAYGEREGILEAALLALRRRRNALLPIARIPPEILTMIFLCADKASRPKFSMPSCVALSHVCQHWRAVAIEQSSLWASIPLTFGHQCAVTFLARAKNAPLSIHDEEDSLHPWKPEFVLENLSRTQSLYAQLGDAGLAMLTAPAPLLHTLDLYGVVSAEAFPNGFLGGCAPALRHLCLTFYDTDVVTLWTLPILTHLVSLDVDLMVEGFPTATSFNGMLDVLAGMRTLEVLKMGWRLEHDVLLTLESAADGKHRRFTLAKLGHLDIRCMPRVAKLFLSFITLPSHATLCCRLDSDYHFNDFQEDIPAFISVALASVHSHVDPTLDSSTAITSLSVRVESLRSRSFEIIARTADPLREPVLSLHSGVWEALQPALKALSSLHLEELTSKNSRGAWWEALGQASRLRRLTVSGAVAGGFFEAIYRPDAEDNDYPSPRRPCFLPALSHLVLKDVKPSLHVIRRGMDGDAVSCRWVDILPLDLAARARAGCRLEELNIMRCGVDEESVARMRKMLPAAIPSSGICTAGSASTINGRRDVLAPADLDPPPKSYTVHTKNELDALLKDESFAHAKGIQLVEVMMDKYDAPLALLRQAELSGQTSKYEPSVVPASHDHGPRNIWALLRLLRVYTDDPMITTGATGLGLTQDKTLPASGRPALCDAANAPDI
ncbi:hypothetical protein FA95DRAFT_1676207 [Auriscalpium vulgare]|uniref:Uncharacterized protein n=1 Tax=Auriscalpium vulgare TaxID=40419 RepID=A0ACB8S4K2_9AGAM|nr:hypothetical protein FA95DRAFT_1676207 [Auriscalpium vulgare]